MTTFIMILLIAFFTLTSSIKIFAWEKNIFTIQLAFFQKYGLNRQILFIVGLIEMFSVLLLAFSFFSSNPLLYSKIGASILAITSVGALYCHLRFDTLKAARPAIVTLILSCLLLNLL